MKEFKLKNLTADRLSNFLTIDKSMGFTPSMAYQNPHTADECKPDLERQKKFLAAMKSNYELGNWGDKKDTADMIEWLEGILNKVEFTDDPAKNSFIMYQIERFMFRIWMRGTEEQRTDMGIDIDYGKEVTPMKVSKAKPKTEHKVVGAPEPAKTKPAAKRTRKPRVQKTEEKKEETPVTEDKPKVEVKTKPKTTKPAKSQGHQTISVEVEEEDRNTTETLVLVFQSMLDQLTPDARRELLSTVVQLMGAYNQ